MENYVTIFNEESKEIKNAYVGLLPILRDK